MSSQHHEYDPIKHSEEKDSLTTLSEPDSEDEPFLHKQKIVQFSNLRSKIPWILAAFFAMSSLVLLVLYLRAERALDQILLLRSQNEFIDPAIIPMEQVRFTGSPQFDEHGNMSHKPYDPSLSWPENVRYFGEPSKELDENWMKLIGARYFSISKKEAQAIWPNTYNDYVDELSGGYTAGLDVFHTLHCVNAIRQALRPDYYNSSSPKEVPHADHCLDAIRQYVMCAGTTTLIPTQWHEGIRRNYIDSDQVHTCRSFTWLREWTTNRGWDQSAYVERDQKVVDPRKHALAEATIREASERMGGHK